MKIMSIVGKEIFDSRGLPTVACEIELQNEVVVVASVPSGSSCSRHEAVEQRDGGARLFGKGVRKAVDVIENIIGPKLIGLDPDVVNIDSLMLELDNTENKSRLGANAMLAVSMAVCRAQAMANEMEPFELIAHIFGEQAVSLPFPMLNMINGGRHAEQTLGIQEFMFVPLGFQNFRESFESSVRIFYALKELLKKNGRTIGVGDEGGFIANFDSEFEALDFMMEAMESAGFKNDGRVVLALDVAASQLYDPATKLYSWNTKKVEREWLIEHYQKLARQYPIYSIEDGLHEDDWDGWTSMTATLGESMQIVGDDIFATNPSRIMVGIQEKAANCVIIKPNQIGTLTETLQSIKLCADNGVSTIVSHRSGETNDSFIADLAVGTSAGQMKAGSCNRGERMEKYNRLLEIEDSLMFSSLDEL